MNIIKLEHAQWSYDRAAPLGPRGGFGAVFAGTGADGMAVAVKRLHVQANEAAHRELRIAKELAGRSFRHVMPVLDAGQDADSDGYFVIMPKAELSLEQFLKSGKQLTEGAAVHVLKEIAAGLAELPNIVHRDLKPANILKHEEAWKIADFGIARFVEEATSTRTLKGFLSPPYAAAEQWREERATSATDIYALGCIAYTLLRGSPPFAGPQSADFANQHLYVDPPTLPEASPRLQSLLLMMLKKDAQLRPSRDRVRAQLQVVGEPSKSGAGANALAQVGAAVGKAQAKDEAMRAAIGAAVAKRLRLARAALDDLNEIARHLCEQIVSVAPQAGYEFSVPFKPVRLHRIGLGQGEVRLGMANNGEIVGPDSLPACRWEVITTGEIVVETRDANRGVSYRRSAALWFTNRGNGDAYRWHELSFMVIVVR